jgi:hypothetical protein
MLSGMVCTCWYRKANHDDASAIVLETVDVWNVQAPSQSPVAMLFRQIAALRLVQLSIASSNVFVQLVNCNWLLVWRCAHSLLVLVTSDVDELVANLQKWVLVPIGSGATFTVYRSIP